MTLGSLLFAYRNRLQDTPVRKEHPPTSQPQTCRQCGFRLPAKFFHLYPRNPTGRKHGCQVKPTCMATWEGRTQIPIREPPAALTMLRFHRNTFATLHGKVQGLLGCWCRRACPQITTAATRVQVARCVSSATLTHALTHAPLTSPCNALRHDAWFLQALGGPHFHRCRRRSCARAAAS